MTADDQRRKSGWKSILREGLTKRIVVVGGKEGKERGKKSLIFRAQVGMLRLSEEREVAAARASKAPVYASGV